MYCALRRQREIRGALDFDTAEPRIKLNSKRKIKSIQIKQRLESHRLIEECMLLANVSVAEFIDRSKRPCLYRVHEQPNATKLEQLNNCLRAFSLKLTGDPCPTTLDFSQLLSTISDSPERVFLQKVILRSQQQARYTSDNIGHFGLGYADYTHFTSPIRRYPDLLVHRTLKSLMNQQDPQGCVYTGSEMDAFAEHCSTLERNAEKASRDAVDRLKCDFMKNKIGNTYQGTIVEVTNFGAFVELDKFLVHGLLHITALKNDYYHFDESTLKLEGKHSGIVYKIGDAIEVVLIRVDIEQRKIDFDLPEKTHSVDEKIN